MTKGRGCMQIRKFLQTAYRAQHPVIKAGLTPFRSVFDSYEFYREIQNLLIPAARKIAAEAKAYPGDKIFIDCGFNDGRILEAFLKELPSFKFYGFEVNEEYFKERALKLQQRYPNIMNLHFKAVTNHGGSEKYFIAGKKNGRYQGLDTTILPDFHQESITDPASHEIPSIDFSCWLEETIAKHTTPDGIKPFVAVKMDIEGAEYAVLEELVRNRTILLVNDLLVEFHTDQFDQERRAEFERREREIREDIASTPVHLLDWV
jgi:FkbM family methyltransferase